MKYYRMKYFLNAMHSFLDDKEHMHAHTFVISLYMELYQEHFLSFYEVDQKIDYFFQEYQGKYLNEQPLFFNIEPTCENMGDLFYEEIRSRLHKHGLHLLQLAISETPVREYMVSDVLLMTSVHSADINNRWEDILTQKEELLAFRN